MTGRDAIPRVVVRTGVLLACALAPMGVVSAQSATLPAPVNQAAERVDRLMDATGVVRFTDLMVDRLQTGARAQLAEIATSRPEAAERNRLAIELIDVMRMSAARAEWRDVIARTLPAETLDGAEKFFATPIGREYTACVDRAATVPDFRQCSEIAVAADDTGAAVHFTAPDLFERHMDPATEQSLRVALTCRAMQAREDLRTRLFSVCRMAGAPPVCALVRNDAEGQRLDPDLCTPASSPAAAGTTP